MLPSKTFRLAGFALLAMGLLSSCAVRRSSLSTTSNSTVNPTCASPLSVSLARVSSADAVVGQEVFFRLEASGCSGQYTFSAQGTTFSQASPLYYSHTYSSAQSVIETVQVQDVNFPTRVSTAMVQFNVVNAGAGAISCATAITPSSLAISSASPTVTANVAISASGASTFRVTAYRYMSGGGATLSSSTPVPSAVASGVNLQISLSAQGQHVFAFDIQDAANSARVATCNAVAQVGNEGVLSFPGTMVQFGTSVSSSSPVTRSIVATNSGSLSMSLQAATIVGASDFTILTDACAGTLAGGDSCTVTVKFDASAGSTGLRSASLSIAYSTTSQSSRTAVVSLQGTAQVGAAVSISSSSTGLNFGTVPPGTTSSVIPVVINNLGPGQARLISVQVSNAVFKVQSDTCPWYSTQQLSLSAGSSCSLGFVFNPSVAGVYNASFNLTFQDSYGANYLSSMTFTGISSGSYDIVASGESFQCAVRAGAAYCWGQNTLGGLGNGTVATKSVPTRVVGMDTGVTSVAAGLLHGCAIKNGGLFCWGYNPYGNLGDGTAALRLSPVAVVGMSSGVTSVAAGGYTTCAIQNGGLKCWGFNAYGQVGDGSTGTALTPVPIFGLESGVSSVSISNQTVTSRSTTCAVQYGGLKCWGYNAQGQVGDGSTQNRNAPYAIPAFSGGVSAVAALSYRTCALQNTTMKCWGQGAQGVLGDGSVANRMVPVVPLGMDIGVTAIGGGTDHTCAVKSGALYCWGNNSDGQLGIGNTIGSNVPVLVYGMNANVELVSKEGQDSSCAMKQSVLYCWGRNNWGQVGNNTLSNVYFPSQVIGW